jgi:hypothetical protein
MRGMQLRRRTILASSVFLAVGLAGLLTLGASRMTAAGRVDTASLPPPGETVLGLNLFGLDTYNRQQVFANLIAHSDWMSSNGRGWLAMPPQQLDRLGWVKYLENGQTAPRPLILPPAPFRPTTVQCTYEGSGELTAGGVASVRSQGERSLILGLNPTGAEGEGAWLELVRTEPGDPLRDLDCRETGLPAGARFHPEFLSFLEGFRVVRFLDWQRVNDNSDVSWSGRTLPESSSQTGAMGASIEDMVGLANAVGADPWFLMPYRADDDYVRNFARLVHQRLGPYRKVYVELGNEIWNTMFDAARQAQSEGLALGLGDGDPSTAQALRYAQQHVRVMRIWTEEFSDEPQRLVRVAAAQNANPYLSNVMLEYADTARWTDALAVAPYVWLDLEGQDVSDVDSIFAAIPAELTETFDFAEQNRAIAIQHGKRLIAYEGGQHLVTPDLDLARTLQRDPRMRGVYADYMDAWRSRMGDALVLYASTAPISEYGSWGLREYAGQPEADAPKLQAVRGELGRRG